jgi:hypothetical protein
MIPDGDAREPRKWKAKQPAKRPNPLIAAM